MKIQIVISILISVLFYLYFHLNKSKTQRNSNNSNIVNSVFIGAISWFILDKCVIAFNENKIQNQMTSSNIYDTEYSVDNEQIIQNLADF
jgi:hypothetical protein